MHPYFRRPEVYAGFDLDNTVAIDAEWGAGYEFRLACIYGKVQSRTFTRTIRPGHKPEVIDANVAYFATPMDIELVKNYVEFTGSFIDVGIVANAAFNYSRFSDAKDRRDLAALAYRVTGNKMRHTITKREHTEHAHQTDKVYLKRLLQHCREDVMFTYLTLKGLLQAGALLPFNNDDIQLWMHHAKNWRHILKRGVPINPKFIKKFSEPESYADVVKLCNDVGCSGFYLDEGRLHVDEKRMQEFLIDTQKVFNWDIEYTPRIWLKNRYVASHKDVFYEFSRSGTAEQREIAAPIYMAKVLWLMGQNRFNWEDRIYPLETPFGQQSSRATPTHNPIAQGSLFRAAVRPTPGNVFVVVDIKSEEPRLGAYLSQDPKLLQATKGDVYSAVHNAIYGTSGTLNKKDAVQRAARDRVKPVMLSFLYMGTWHTFKDKIGCTEIEAKTIERNLNFEFKIYKEWAHDVIAAAKYAGIVRTPLHHYPLLVDEQCNERQVVNHLIQGCGADLMRELVDSCINAGYVPNTTLFDGLYFETTKEGVAEFSKELIALCNRTLNRVFPVHIPWEMEITPSLWDNKPYHEYGIFEKPEQVDLLRRLHWEDVI